MALLRPIWMQSTGGDAAIQYSGLELRNIISGLVRAEGVLQNGFAVTQRGAGANFSVDVASGFAVVNGDDVAGQGIYLIRSDATTNVATPGAPASGTRVHRLVAQIRDKFHNGAYSTYEFTLDLLQDTGSGTPATPNSALNLARISIAAAQANVSNANITNDRIDASLVSGQRQQVSSASGRPGNPFTAEDIWRTDLLYSELYNGSGWIPGTGALPKARISRSTNQLVTTGSNASVTLATTDYATTPTLVSGSTLIPTIAGQYELTAHLQWASGVAGYYQARILDGSGAALAGASGNVTSGVGAITTATTVVNVTSGMVGGSTGTFSLGAFQNSGSSVNITSGYLICRYTGPAM